MGIGPSALDREAILDKIFKEISSFKRASCRTEPMCRTRSSPSAWPSGELELNQNGLSGGGGSSTWAATMTRELFST